MSLHNFSIFYAEGFAMPGVQFPQLRRFGAPMWWVWSRWQLQSHSSYETQSLVCSQNVPVIQYIYIYIYSHLYIYIYVYILYIYAHSSPTSTMVFGCVLWMGPQKELSSPGWSSPHGSLESLWNYQAFQTKMPYGKASIDWCHASRLLRHSRCKTHSWWYPLLLGFKCCVLSLQDATW